MKLFVLIILLTVSSSTFAWQKMAVCPDGLVVDKECRWDHRYGTQCNYQAVLTKKGLNHFIDNRVLTLGPDQYLLKDLKKHNNRYFSKSTKPSDTTIHQSVSFDSGVVSLEISKLVLHKYSNSNFKFYSCEFFD